MSGAPDRLFEGGTPTHLRAWCNLRASETRSVIRTAVLVGAIAWGPLAVFALVQGHGQPFAIDFGVHARFLLAAPLLIAAELVTGPRLGLIARHFFDSGLVATADATRFESAIVSTLQWRDSIWAEIAIIALAYAIVIALVVWVPAREIPQWHGTPDASGGAAGYSWAGWWHLAVSMPLLLMIGLAWAWRLVCWTRFLFRMTQIDLQLVPAHPDRAAGLKFVAYSLRAFAPIGFAIGVVAAGRLANEVFHYGESPLDHSAAVLFTCAAVLVAFAAPPFVFTHTLLDAWRRGVFEYGALADRIGQRFEAKWLSRKRRQDVDESALESPDFSSTTDLYSIVSNAYAMRVAPIDLMSMLALLAATALPFAPVFAAAIPLEQILKGIAGLLF
ncbi:MAG: hypothetical protein ACREYC_04585 [Gammaproteobacteria bacterium]